MTDPTLTWRRRALGCDRFADRDLLMPSAA
jgi:hypothetical protein